MSSPLKLRTACRLVPSQVECELEVSAMVLTPRAAPFSVSQNLSRDPSLSAIKSHARTHTDGEPHNKVAEVGEPFTGNLCPLTLRGAWLFTNTRPAATDSWLGSRCVLACRDHRRLTKRRASRLESESDQWPDEAISNNSNRQRRDRSCKDS